MLKTNFVLEVKNFSKIFENGRGVFDLNFSIPKGALVALIGPNGSGKTTLIRSILRLYQEYVGDILINGETNENPATLNNISYIGESALFPNGVTMEKYLYWMCMMKGVKKGTVMSKIRALAKSFNLENYLKRKPIKFSSGEKQKVMLIKSIIEDSNVLIMDEPTSNLDPEAREVFFLEVEKLNQEGKSVLVISHNLEELESRATHILVINNGEQKYFAKKTDKHTISQIFHKYNKKNKGIKNE